MTSVDYVLYVKFEDDDCLSIEDLGYDEEFGIACMYSKEDKAIKKADELASILRAVKKSDMVSVQVVEMVVDSNDDIETEVIYEAEV